VSANEVIEQIRQLPQEERRKVVAFVHELETAGGLSEEFKRMADEVFTTNAELFRKLAQ
jgi:ABC-type cobalamin/Fe3+-siderophores transport system ATPase subunit